MSNKQNDIYNENLKEIQEEALAFHCIRCNNNGCPVCDTKGIGGANKQYNPEPY